MSWRPGRSRDSSLPVLVFPAGGTADEETLAAAEDLEPAAILLSDISDR